MTDKLVRGNKNACFPVTGEKTSIIQFLWSLDIISCWSIINSTSKRERPYRKVMTPLTDRRKYIHSG